MKRYEPELQTPQDENNNWHHHDEAVMEECPDGDWINADELLDYLDLHFPIEYEVSHQEYQERVWYLKDMLKVKK